MFDSLKIQMFESLIYVVPYDKYTTCSQIQAFKHIKVQTAKLSNVEAYKVQSMNIQTLKLSSFEHFKL